MLIAALAGAQAILPGLVAVAAFYATIISSGSTFEPASSAVVIVTVLCLVLVQPPGDVNTQMTSPRMSVVLDVTFRWLLLLTILLAIGYVTKSLQSFPRRLFLVWAAATPVALVGATLAMQEAIRYFLRSAFDIRSVIVVGYNNSSLQLARRLRSNPGNLLDVVGFFDDRNSERLALAPDARLLGTLSDLGDYVRENRTAVIFVALPIRHVQRVMNLLDDLRDTTASVYYVPDVFVFDLIQARSGEVHGIPVVAMCETPFYGYRGVTKRLIDIALSLVMLVLLVPVLALISVMVKVSSPGPVIFRQRRYGLDGVEISVYKFRTMRVTEDGTAIRQASRSDPRITPVGRLLRRTSLDELPQLINVLQGRMSLVGPRPHAVAHNEEYRKLIKGYMVRHKVLPGITGLAQINGCRGETAELKDMEARVNFDLDYLRHWSTMLDFKIIFLTIFKVFRDDNAY